MSYFPHQVEGAAYLNNHQGAMLWWDVRSGKTRAAILGARSAGKKLVAVVPAIARGVWLHEWQEVGGDPAAVATCFGKTNRKVEGNLKDAELVIVGWDTLQAWLPFLRALGGGFNIAFDESHSSLSNPNAQRWHAAHALAQLGDGVALLSGTPYRQSAMDFWAQLRVLGDRIPFQDANQFGSRHCYRRPNPFTRRGWEWWGLRNEAQLIASAPIHRVRETGLLGERRVTWLDEPKLLLGYDTADGGSLARARRRLAVTKAERVRDLVYGDLTQMRPVVVFGWHHDFLARVQDLLKCPVIEGSTPPWQRQELIKLLNEGQIPILACQMAAAGVAIDLAAAQHAVFGELDWNESTHRQAEGRLRGPRQRGQVMYHYLVVRNSVEEYVWGVRLSKGRAMDRLDKAAG